MKLPPIGSWARNNDQKALTFAHHHERIFQPNQAHVDMRLPENVEPKTMQISFVALPQVEEKIKNYEVKSKLKSP